MVCEKKLKAVIAALRNCKADLDINQTPLPTPKGSNYDMRDVCPMVLGAVEEWALKEGILKAEDSFEGRVKKSNELVVEARKRYENDHPFADPVSDSVILEEMGIEQQLAKLWTVPVSESLTLCELALYEIEQKANTESIAA